MEKTLKELAEYVGGTAVGDPTVKITGVMAIDDAQAGYITFISNEKYTKKVHQTNASAIIVSPKLKDIKKNLLVCKNPYLAFAKLVELLMYKKPTYTKGIDDSARIGKTAIIGEAVSISAYATIGENTRIGNRVVIYPGVHIGDHCTIGDDTVIYPNAVIYNDTVIGNRVAIHSNTVIGSNGFGYAPDGQSYYKIPQVEIGENSLIVSQVGIAGSTKVGKHVTLAGGVGVVGHLKIGDNVTVGGYSGVAHDIPDNETYLGTPALPIQRMRRCYVIIERLPEMREHIKTLEKRIEQLEKRDSAPRSTHS